MSTPRQWNPVGSARWLSKCAPQLNWSLLSASIRLDPYLVWNDLTSMPVNPKSDDVVGVLMQAESNEAAQGMRQPPSAGSQPSRGQASVQVAGKMLYGQANPLFLASFAQIAGKGSLHSIELCAPRTIENVGAISPSYRITLLKDNAAFLWTSNEGMRAYLGKLDTLVNLPRQQKSAPQVQNLESKVVPPAPAAPLLCVVDDRCNFASSAFGPRILSIWNQSSDERTKARVYDLAPCWKPSVGVLSGRILTPSDLRGPKKSEFDLYREAHYLYPTPRWSHGSAVLDLFAGNDVRFPCAAPGMPLREVGRQRWHGATPAHVHFVQLPVSTVMDTSGGALAAHVLDAIQYAIDKADNNQAVIVNCSYGTHGGSHDGTSMFERALKELLNRYDGNQRPGIDGKTLYVVVPAGNSHLLRCHASHWLAPGAETKLLWKVMPDDPTENFVEVWVDEGDEVSITVTPPSGESSGAVCRGETVCWETGNNKVHAAIVFPKEVTQGLCGTMALIAVSPTREHGYVASDKTGVVPVTRNASTGAPRPSALAPHGIWTITVCNMKQSNGRHEQCANVHAWVQRGDSAPGRGREERGHRGRQPYFLDDGTGLIEPRFTLNGIATIKHERLHVVGAIRQQDYSVSRYSAAGPNRSNVERVDGPDLVTFADQSINLPGLLLRGASAGSRVRVGGTSIAAPLVARLLYEHLAAKRPHATFIHDWSCSGTTRRDKVAEGEPEWAAPGYRGSRQPMVPVNDDGSLIDPASSTCARPSAGEEAGSQSPCLLSSR